MAATALTHRLARQDDLSALRSLMDHAICELQRPFLTEAAAASSRAFMCLPTQLIKDGTDFVVEADGQIAHGDAAETEVKEQTFSVTRCRYARMSHGEISR